MIPRAEKVPGTFLVVKQLTKVFPLLDPWTRRKVGEVAALDQVTCSLGDHETLGIVGESGSGKSTLGKIVCRLLEPTGGQVQFQGQEILALRGSALKAFRRQVQMIFQDAYASLNPLMAVEEILLEPYQIHQLCPVAEAKQRMAKLLEEVGLPRDTLRQRPYELSGGQRQRVNIARALTLEPKLLICDEPVSALDLSIQAQILNLLLELQTRHRYGCLFISHDLRVVANVSDRVLVLQHGRIVEEGPTRQLFTQPAHPYTKHLVSAI